MAWSPTIAARAKINARCKKFRFFDKSRGGEKTRREGGKKIKNFQFFVFLPPSLSGF
jgi:hypothetical protein